MLFLHTKSTHGCQGKLFGPDVSASLTLDELRLIVEAAAAFKTLEGHPVDKDVMAGELAPTRALFSKSLAPREFLPAGTILEPGLLTLKKPGTGIGSRELDQITGRRLCRDVAKDRLLRWEDLE